LGVVPIPQLPDDRLLVRLLIVLNDAVSGLFEGFGPRGEARVADHEEPLVLPRCWPDRFQVVGGADRLVDLGGLVGDVHRVGRDERVLDGGRQGSLQ
jgi:hypothetical protein